MNVQCPSCGKIIKLKNKKSARCYNCGSHVKIIREKEGKDRK